MNNYVPNYEEQAYQVHGRELGWRVSQCQQQGYPYQVQPQGGGVYVIIVQAPPNANPFAYQTQHRQHKPAMWRPSPASLRWLVAGAVVAVVFGAFDAWTWGHPERTIPRVLGWGQITTAVAFAIVAALVAVWWRLATGKGPAGYKPAVPGWAMVAALVVLALVVLGAALAGKTLLMRTVQTAMLFALTCIAVYLMLILGASVTSPVYQSGYTAREQEREQTRRVQAQEWGDTLRTWGQWGAGGLAVVVVAGAGAWTAVQWQRERTRRHGMTEQRRIVLAYIAANGGRAGQLAGVEGVYLDASREFVPWQVAAAELPAAALLTVDA